MCVCVCVYVRASVCACVRIFVQTISQKGDQRAIKMLIEKLEEERIQQRIPREEVMSCLLDLSEIGNKGVVYALAMHCDSQSEGIRTTALRGLKKLCLPGDVQATKAVARMAERDSLLALRAAASKFLVYLAPDVEIPGQLHALSLSVKCCS